MSNPANNPATPVQKFRPVLTALQIEFLLGLVKVQSPLTKEAISCISTLAPFQAKIANAAITAAYTTAPRVLANSLESLGGTDESAISARVASAFSKEQLWEFCYNKFVANPQGCSLEEITNAQEHAYLNDLMTEAELATFEGREPVPEPVQVSSDCEQAPVQPPEVTTL